MSSPIIQVNNLSKQYHLGARERINRTFREAVVDTLTAPIRNFRQLRNLTKFENAENKIPYIESKDSSALYPSPSVPMQSSPGDTIWALKDVSFEVQPGEVIGIIGRNGAGKSTLLKILSRITEPTSGEVMLHGRVASLLEVGTGFHPELTGRENIYLNGTILGMQKAEIDYKFDEIVAFSEIEKFLDTPVKRYSSGMYVRLAFAVAAHLEPEILLVDEVLAVGDAAFQKKCLGKMEDVARHGRTILFVSHNTSAVQSLCSRTIWIDTGGIRMEGPSSAVVAAYLHQGYVSESRRVWPDGVGPGNNSLNLVSITLKNSFGEPCSSINISEELNVEIRYAVTRAGTRAIFSLHLRDENDLHVFSSLSNTAENNLHDIPLQPGHYQCVCTIPGNLLNNGRYFISLKGMSGWADSFIADHVISFDGLDDGILKRDYAGRLGGVMRPQLIWTSSSLDDPANPSS